MEVIYTSEEEQVVNWKVGGFREDVRKGVGE